jgi:hypothetical protein
MLANETWCFILPRVDFLRLIVLGKDADDALRLKDNFESDMRAEMM